MSAKLSDVLELAGDLLQQSGYCKGPLATNIEGSAVSIHSPRAINFCLWGAVCKAERVLEYDTRDGYRFLLGAMGCERDPIGFSESPETTSLQASFVLWKAAELARKEGR